MIRPRGPFAVLTLVLVGACRQAEPPAEAGKPAPAAPFEAPRLGVYVTNETSGDLSVIDATTGTVVGVVQHVRRPTLGSVEVAALRNGDRLRRDQLLDGPHEADDDLLEAVQQVGAHALTCNERDVTCTVSPGAIGGMGRLKSASNSR